jgi:formate dehydrogenase accessory protein FdhD
VRSDGERETLHLTEKWRASNAMPVAFRKVPAERLHGNRRERIDDVVAEETAVALVYNGTSHAVMMATPADLADFAVGFSLGEGIVAAVGEIEIVDILEVSGGISIQMAIPSSRFEALQARSRNLVGRVGCGLCGADSLEAAIRPVSPVRTEIDIDPVAIRTGLQALQSAQVLNARCHGLHAAGFVSPNGSVVVREDVGRHNAIDKLIGALARAAMATDDGFIAVTSRASYEVVHKVASAGIGLVVAVSAPTALAIDLARRANVKLVAFARDDAMTVYADRLRDQPVS